MSVNHTPPHSIFIQILHLFSSQFIFTLLSFLHTKPILKYKINKKSSPTSIICWIRPCSSMYILCRTNPYETFERIKKSKEKKAGYYQGHPAILLVHPTIFHKPQNTPQYIFCTKSWFICFLVTLLLSLFVRDCAVRYLEF